MATLPSYARILTDGFEEQRGKNGNVRSNMEAGPSKQRRVQTRNMVNRPVKLLIEGKANYQAWVAWVLDTLQSGSDWFAWVDPVDSTSKQARILNGEYTAQPSAGMRRWHVSLTLETWE